MTQTLTRAHFVTNKELIEKVDRLVGPRRRSAFITAAVENELQREQLLQLTREVMKLPPEKDVPGWETPEAVSRWVHDLRAENDRIRNV